MTKRILDMDQFKATARAVVAESIVMLENKEQTLPIQAGTRLAVFGRIAFDYYKSGTGSGGLVNTTYVTSILDALKSEESLILDQNLLDTYQEWLAEHPFDKGAGWGQEPWSQEEMPLTDDLVTKMAKANDVALVVIGRTAGEDKDAANEAGSYLLTELEMTMLKQVRGAFDKMIVVLNVGNIIDMKWVDDIQPDSLLYVWQGGQEGGNGVADVLMGRVNPSGKLPDTIAYNIEDYPAYENFGDAEENIYAEDIYVGYRYFETFNPSSIQYPFGFGLSYTDFELTTTDVKHTDSEITLTVHVTNTGNVAGKEVVQVYVKAPQGELGKPAIELKAYAKTELLAAGASQEVVLRVPVASLASYDDIKRFAYVLEAGHYQLLVGNSSQHLMVADEFDTDGAIIEQLTQALAPTKDYERLANADGRAVKVAGPKRQYDLEARIVSQKPTQLARTKDRGYTFDDVVAGDVTIEAFVAQFSDKDLFNIIIGEGMSSPRVTPGVAAAFGGVTDSLTAFGIPAGACADGPSGIRMDSGATAFSLPNGTAIGATFNDNLIEQLYQFEGLELRKNKIDSLLGPGINIHRHPLNGRNFEYISEDPLLTGKMAAAQLRGFHSVGVTGTLKHFAANNQEFHRNDVNGVISERALREIYLKGFEIAVKEADAKSIMTTYGPINGIWTASNYDLVTQVLRNEWGFTGIVMTDWWAKVNREGQEADRKDFAAMVRAQNDLYMVSQSAELPYIADNLQENLDLGYITRGDLQRSACNIVRFLAWSTPFKSAEIEVLNDDETSQHYNELNFFAIGDETIIHLDNTEIAGSYVFGLTFASHGLYQVTAQLSSQTDNEVAQLAMSVFYDNQLKGSIQVPVTHQGTFEDVIDLGVVFGANHFMKLHFPVGGLKLEALTITKTADFTYPM